MAEFKIPTFRQIATSLAIALLLHFPIKLVENAVTSWTDDRISQYFGLSTPSIVNVIAFVWSWVVPFVAAIVVLIFYHHANKHWPARQLTLSDLAQRLGSRWKGAITGPLILAIGIISGIVGMGVWFWLDRPQIATQPTSTALQTKTNQQPPNNTSTVVPPVKEENLVGRARFLYDHRSASMTLINKQNLELATVDRDRSLFAVLSSISGERFIVRLALYYSSGPFDIHVREEESSSLMRIYPIIYYVDENDKSYVRLLFEPSLIGMTSDMSAIEVTISLYRK